MPFSTLATLNQVIFFGLLLLALLSLGHLYYRFRFSVLEERLVIGLFAAYVLLSAADRSIAAHLIRLSAAENLLGVWGPLSVVARILFALMVWGMALYVLLVIWPPRMSRRKD